MFCTSVKQNLRGILSEEKSFFVEGPLRCQSPNIFSLALLREEDIVDLFYPEKAFFLERA